MSTVRDFYQALARADAEGIRQVYTDDVVYSDPVFGELRGSRVMLMWEMFCARDDKIQVEFGDITVQPGDLVTARWVARYAFGDKNRPIENPIHSTFRFRDGLICEHRDTFHVRKWAAQALGPVGRVLGNTPPVRKALHRKSTALLDSYDSRRT